jgi:hypothetical protein
VTEPSDLARDVLTRYRRSISPSSEQRDGLVREVVRRANGGPGPGGGGGATPTGSWAPWLAVVGVAFVVVGGVLWSARGDAVDAIDPAFERARVLARMHVEDPPPVAVASIQPRASKETSSSIEPSTSSVDVAAEREATIDPPPPIAARPRNRSARVTSSPDPAPAAAPEPDLVDEEVRLLREANVALRQGRDAIARGYFDEHARRFPDGALVELREVGRAIMRCRGATTEVAAETVAAFTARFPGSPHLARLARECPSTDPP